MLPRMGERGAGAGDAGVPGLEREADAACAVPQPDWFGISRLIAKAHAQASVGELTREQVVEHMQELRSLVPEDRQELRGEVERELLALLP